MALDRFDSNICLLPYFEVNIPANKDNVMMDLVPCLHVYIERTSSVTPADSKPLFLTINTPYFLFVCLILYVPSTIFQL